MANKNIPASGERLKKDVYAITGTKTARNFLHPEVLNETAAYIKKEWEKLGLKVEEQPYKVEGREYKNLICSIGPEEGKRIIVGAHYDVCEGQPGADDNASGVAGILELARLLVSEEPELKYRIDLVAYTLEEPPFFRTSKMGSAVHAKHLHDNNISVRAMIALEMIGYFSEEKQSQSYPLPLMKLFYPSKGDYIAVAGNIRSRSLVKNVKKQIKAGSGIRVATIAAPAFIPGLDFSDHLNYWKYGYKAVMITDTAFYRNKNYHQTTDTPDTLDYDKMAEVVKGVYWAVVGMD